MLLQHQHTHSDKQKLGSRGMSAACSTPNTQMLRIVNDEATGARLPKVPPQRSLAARTAEEEAGAP